MLEVQGGEAGSLVATLPDSPAPSTRHPARDSAVKEKVWGGLDVIKCVLSAALIVVLLHSAYTSRTHNTSPGCEVDNRAGLEAPQCRCELTNMDRRVRQTWSSGRPKL